MKFRILGFVPTLLFFHSAWAEVKGPAWLSDPRHPSLQYRFVCNGGSSQNVIWRNGYPGAVTIKARTRGYDYDGVEDVQIEPGATADINLQSLNCGNFQVSVTRFSMATPPPPPPPPASAGVKAVPAAAPKADPPPVAPILVMFERSTEPVPEITPEALASIAIGMNQAEVRQKLGEPLSKISIPDDQGLVERYRYLVTEDQPAVVKFANGIVVGIIPPR